MTVQNETSRAKTVRLFLLFSMQQDAAPWQALLEAAADEVRQELRPDADPDDVRLCCYTAAVANLRYRQLTAAQGAVSPTYAGSVPRSRDDTKPCGFAERLVLAYREAAADLLTDRGFVFSGIK